MAADLDGYEKRVVEETRIRTDLGRYLSAEVVEGIIHRTIELELGGERREVTVLFADVVAFTPLTEAHPPEQVVATLNELFTILTEIVFRHGGIVDKFIGDSVMAVFGAPRAVPDSAVAAARAAEEMLAWLETGNVRWRKQLGRDLELAIGMNTGEVVAGNLGSERRMEYTVIGDVVNTAARLETLARPGQVLMTEATQRRLGEAFEVEPLGEHALPGRKKPLVIYALVTT
jgi:class 3 adenylate cyclase